MYYMPQNTGNTRKHIANGDKSLDLKSKNGITLLQNNLIAKSVAMIFYSSYVYCESGLNYE